jgi:hypothetical protein
MRHFRRNIHSFSRGSVHEDSNHAYWLEFLRKDSSKYRFIPTSLKSNKEFMFKLVENNGLMYITIRRDSTVKIDMKSLCLKSLETNNSSTRRLPLEEFNQIFFTGTEFNKYFGNRVYVKPLLETDKLSVGLNEINFQKHLKGIHFIENHQYSQENKYNIYKKSKKFCKVQIPDSSTVGIDKFGLYSNKLILGNEEDIKLLKDQISFSEDSMRSFYIE